LTVKIEIIPVEERHLETLRIERNKDDVRMNFSNCRLLSQAEQKDWYVKVSSDKTRKYFAVENGGKFAGSIWFDEWDFVNRSCRVGLFIIAKYRNKGIGYKALREFLSHLSNSLGIHRVWLLVMVENTPAISLYRRLGFKEEGTQKDAIYRNQTWHNYLMMAHIEGGEKK